MSLSMMHTNGELDMKKSGQKYRMKAEENYDLSQTYWLDVEQETTGTSGAIIDCGQRAPAPRSWGLPSPSFRSEPSEA